MCSEPTRLTHLDASGAGEGRLGVHEPVLPQQRREMGGEGPPIAQAAEIIEEAGRLGWELVGHNQTNPLRLTEMDGSQERDAVRATIDRIETASGKRPVGWLGAG